VEIEQLLDYLENAGSNIEIRARLESQFMPLLEFTRPARTFGAALQAQPTLFAEIMSIVYRAEGDRPMHQCPPSARPSRTFARSSRGTCRPVSWLTEPWTLTSSARGLARLAVFWPNLADA
jgi:hypothetical protein